MSLANLSHRQGAAVDTRLVDCSHSSRVDAVVRRIERAASPAGPKDPKIELKAILVAFEVIRSFVAAHKNDVLGMPG